MTPRQRLAAALTGLVALCLLAAGPGGAASSKRPAAPAQARAAAGSATSVVVRWSDRASNEFRYEVSYRRAGSKRSGLARLPRDATRFVHRNLRPATTYSYRVRACNSRGCSALSAAAIATTRRLSAPGPGGSPRVGGCPVFPSDNPWNRDVSRLPVDPRSDRYVASISAGGNRFLHADFGGGGEYGIPFVEVPEDQRRVPVRFEYADESDPGPYPIPPDPPVERGSDRHILVVQRGTCRLYELFAAEPAPRAKRVAGEGWSAGSGAVFDLRSNAVRPKYWTSGDAAGLPILPGLARYDEVAAGRIDHALRFTVERSQRGFIFPARHFASSSTDPDLPPMGLRLRLKASYDLSRFRGQARVILEALKRYGMINADNGTSWYVTGASDRRWDDEDLNQLKTVPGSAFEAVDTGYPIER